MSKAIGTLGAVDTITIGNVIFTDVSNLIMVSGYVTDGTNKWTSFRKPAGSSGYTPSGSKTFHVRAVRIFSLGTVGNGTGFILGYNNIDLGLSGTTSPSSPIYIGGDSTATLANVVVFGSSVVTGTTIEAVVDFVIPNTKYIFASNAGSASSALIQIFGYEE